MATGHQLRHAVEFGGSPVGTEFDGSLSFQSIDRVPIFTVSQDFTAHTARQLRYGLVATWGPERPFYQRYPWVVLDLRMVTGWQEGAPAFVAQLGDLLRRERGGDLVLVAYDTSNLPGEYLAAGTVDEAVALVKERREAARLAVLRR